MSTSQIVALSQADINARVQSSNSFSKAEMTVHRSAITDARRQKRERLSTMTGSQLGTMVEAVQKEHGATVREVRHRLNASGTKQTWTIELTAKANLTESERLAEKAKRLAKQLNDAEEKHKEALAKEKAVEVKIVTATK